MPATDPAYLEACCLLGVDPSRVPLVGPSEWKRIVGRGVPRRARGVASMRHKVIYVKRGSPADVYVHELLHLLFPSRPHWWIHEATWLLCSIEMKSRWRYAGGHWTRSGRHAMEPPQRIRELAQRAAGRKGLAGDGAGSSVKQCLRPSPQLGDLTLSTARDGPYIPGQGGRGH